MRPHMPTQSITQNSTSYEQPTEIGEYKKWRTMLIWPKGTYMDVSLYVLHFSNSNEHAYHILYNSQLCQIMTLNIW